MKKPFLPKAFIEKYSELLGAEAEEFFKFCQRKLRPSLWANSLKISPEQLTKNLESAGWSVENLPIHQNAFLIIEGPRQPGQSSAFKQGLFNLQEIASMIPAVVLAPQKGERVLDAAAAPGNKTLQLCCLMENQGEIVALDENRVRFKSLAYNIRKFGMKNVKAFNKSLLSVQTQKPFDKILLDAPCSSEGLVRKDFDALRHWSKKLVERKAKLQTKMILKAWQMLKPCGTLVYSTCTLSPEENEAVMSKLLQKNADAEIEKIAIGNFKLRNGLIEYKNKKFESGVENCVRILPQDNDTQAFFVAKIRKD